MAVSYNENVKIGDSVFHVQTEYYKKSGKVVSNIFKDGLSIKRLERAVEDDQNIDAVVGEFHNYVIEKLKDGLKKKLELQKAGYSLEIPEVVEEELLQVLYPYFGVASSFILEEALSLSKNLGEFMENLLDGLPEDTKLTLKEEISTLLSSLTNSKETTESEDLPKPAEELSEEKKEKILYIISDYFGIMALPVLEEVLEEWSGSNYQEFVDLIVKRIEDEKEREELYQRLMFL